MRRLIWTILFIAFPALAQTPTTAVKPPFRLDQLTPQPSHTFPCVPGGSTAVLQACTLASYFSFSGSALQLANTTIGSTSIAPGATATTIAGLTLTAPTITGGALSGTFSGTPTFSGVPKFTGLATGTQVSCAGFDSGNNLVLATGACSSGGGGSPLTTTDGTNSVTSTTSLTFANNFVLSGSAGAATVKITAPNSTKSANYTFAAADMGGGVNLNGTFTLTIPAISSTIFANGMTSCYQNRGNGIVTIASTPTINGLTGTAIPPGAGGCFVSNGTTLDWQAGLQPASTTVLGGTFLGGRMNQVVRVVTAAGVITMTTADYLVCVNKTTGAATTVNLPASPVAGDQYIIKDCKGDAATNNITLTPAAGNIDGTGTFVMNVNRMARGVFYDGTGWQVF